MKYAANAGTSLRGDIDTTDDKNVIQTNLKGLDTGGDTIGDRGDAIQCFWEENTLKRIEMKTQGNSRIQKTLE